MKITENKYHVYQHKGFIDWLDAVMHPRKVYASDYNSGNERSINEDFGQVAQAFYAAGWEGDGNIGILWIPSFVHADNEDDTWGEFIWHVKQRNNGISYLACEHELNFPGLEEQDYKNKKEDDLYVYHRKR